MKKKIKIFITYENGATINRIFAYANVLGKKHLVEIVILATQANELHRDLLDADIEITYVFWDGIVPPNFFLRFLSEYSLVKKLSKKLDGSEDTIFVSIPFFALLFLPFTKRNNAHKILDIRDLNWEYLPSTNPVLKMAKTTMSNIAKQYISRFDKIIVTNIYEKKWVESSNNISPTLIYNGIARDQFKNLIKIQHRRSAEDRITISYIGNVGIAQNLLSFIKVVKNYPAYLFQIIGDGNDYAQIKYYVEKNNINNVVLLGRVSFTEVPKYYSEADILFAKLDSNYKTAVPSKLFEMLTTNKPMIYSGEGAALEVLKMFDNIYYYDTDIDLGKILNEIQENGFNLSLHNQDKVKANFIREDMVENNLKIFTA